MRIRMGRYLEVKYGIMRTCPRVLVQCWRCADGLVTIIRLYLKMILCSPSEVSLYFTLWWTLLDWNKVCDHLNHELAGSAPSLQ